LQSVQAQNFSRIQAACPAGESASPYPSDCGAGRVVPRLGAISEADAQGLPRSFRLALTSQFSREGIVRFRQIELEQSLTRLFIDLDADVTGLSSESQDQQSELRRLQIASWETHAPLEWTEWAFRQRYMVMRSGGMLSCLALLTSEATEEGRGGFKRIVLEGGPGQGKSTITQMLAQLYRALLLQRVADYSKIAMPERARIPFRIDLRLFAEWLDQTDGTVEQFISRLFTKDGGGHEITVEDIQSLVESSPVLLIFDGLDEVGRDELRDAVLTKIAECLDRFENGLKADAKAIVTTRPPAIAGRGNKLSGFVSAHILPLDTEKVNKYVARWTDVQCIDSEDRERVMDSFNKRKHEVHVQALAKNPMQLSVLLHFIRLKGEAFPDRRAELYREYFKTVIDRDIEKTPRLRTMREDIEALHEVLGFKIHSLAETDKASGSLGRAQLIKIVEEWLLAEGRPLAPAQTIFTLGEERLGLIVALKGEAGDTRYGFEIQPVREYFAAAFINERWPANAHDVFAAMARRPFWKEVALFLAGLRRSNEKADLLSRARALDREPSVGWRQDGRFIVLQLLQEGVLTVPGHVQQDAISFLLELLDPLDLKVRNEPADLLSALSSLTKACASKVHEGYLEALLTSARNSADAGALIRLYFVAGSVLAAEKVLAQTREYDSAKLQLGAMVRLSWSKLSASSLVEASRSAGFWPPLPRPDWASVWYQVGCRESGKTALVADPAYHQLLVEQFAFTCVAAARRDALENKFFQPRSDWAVWALVSNLQKAAAIIAGLTGDPGEVPPPPTSFRCDGLLGDLSAGMGELTESSYDAVEDLRAKQRSPKGLERLLRVISSRLGDDGLTGWVACRCAVTLLEATVATDSAQAAMIDLEETHVFTAHSATRRSHPVALERRRTWRDLRPLLTAFYREGIKYDLDAGGRSTASRIVRERYSLTCPSHVRIRGRFVSAPAALLRMIEGETPMYGWLSHLPIPRYWVRTLLNVDPQRVPHVLAHIAHRSCSFGGPSFKLTAPIIQKALAAVRRASHASCQSTPAIHQRIIRAARTRQSDRPYPACSNKPDLDSASRPSAGTRGKFPSETCCIQPGCAPDRN
jgi:hypothetical protein